jgi:membrane-associated phospholipid phosphatase
MPAQAGLDESSSYFSGFFALVQASAAQTVRSSSHPRRAVAGRRSLRHALVLGIVAGVVVVVSMYGLDAMEIGLMPPRGAGALWPVRILTDFGKSAYVLCALAAALFAVATILPWLHGAARSTLLRFGTHLRFVFFAVLVPVLAGEIVKWIVGRGRPFVGGEANAFNFAHFAGTEAYASFPSSHAITSFALAFAVSAVWPGARPMMFVYALLIATTRLVLLAHHPSDVVAGASIGVIGATFVQYWFAARRLGFSIDRDGAILPRSGLSLDELKRVARGTLAS